MISLWQCHATHQYIIRLFELEFTFHDYFIRFHLIHHSAHAIIVTAGFQYDNRVDFFIFYIITTLLCKLWNLHLHLPKVWIVIIVIVIDAICLSLVVIIVIYISSVIDIV